LPDLNCAALYNKLDLDWDSQTLLKIASGEQSFQGVSPIASVYAGHQFGHEERSTARPSAPLE
jgi:uncharacterized protein YdiU (UPF0061 family)